MTETLMADGDLTYSIKELLEEIRSKVDQLSVKLDHKAERSAVERLDKSVLLLEAKDQTRQGMRVDEQTAINQLSKEVAELSKTVSELQRRADSTREASEAVAGYRKWLIGVTLTVASLLISVIWLASSHIH